MGYVSLIIFNGDILKAHDFYFKPIVYIPGSEPSCIKGSQSTDTGWRIVPGDGTFRIRKIHLIALY